MCDWSTEQLQPKKDIPQTGIDICATNICAGTEFQKKTLPALGANTMHWTIKVLLSFFSPVLNLLMPPMQLMYVLKEVLKRTLFCHLYWLTKA